MRLGSMMQSRYSKWIGLIAVWTAVGLILSTEVYFTVRVDRVTQTGPPRWLVWLG